MTQDLNTLLAQANAVAEESGIDMNEAVKGGGGSRLLPVGYAFGQLVEYIEYGQQPQEFNGVAKAPAMEFSLGFALSGQTATGEKYHNDDGTPYVLRPYSMALSQNEKARAFLLFKSLNWKRTAKNFGQLLGQKFLVKIVQEPKSKADQSLVSRIDFKGFLPPLDPVTQQPYPIPDAPANLYRAFFWSRPTKEGWDSLFIEGQYEAKDGKPAASKNRLQETCLKAVDFQGSALQLMLGGVGAPPAVAPASPAVASVAQVATQVPAVTPSPVATPQVAPQAQPALDVIGGIPAVTEPAAPQVAVVAAPVMAALPSINLPV